MISILDLNPQTAQTVRRVMLEMAAYRHRFRTSRSTPIKLGSKSEVIIHPTVKDTQNNVTDDGVFKFGKQKNEAAEFFLERQSLFNQAKGKIALAHLWVKANKQPAVVFYTKNGNHITFRSKRVYDQIDPEQKKQHGVLKVIHPYNAKIH